MTNKAAARLIKLNIYREPNDLIDTRSEGKDCVDAYISDQLAIVEIATAIPVKNGNFHEHTP